MATADASEPSTCGEKRKEVVVSYMTSDSPYDASENTKMKILLTTSMSSSCGEVISFVDYEDKTEFMTLKPRDISQIVEQGGKKYLCLEYGPKRKAKFILLDFTDETRENLDEWNVFLCRMMGLESKPPRRNTVNDKNIHRRKMAPVLRTISAFLPTSTPNFGPANSGDAPNSPVQLDPPSSGTASGSESPEISDGGSTSTMSPFGSLESTEETDYMTDKIYDCPKDLLNQHQFKKHQDDIVVTQSVPGSELHVGNTIALRTNEGTTGERITLENVKELRDYIKNTEAPTIRLAVTPGVVITMKNEDQELTINISGPKRPDAVEAVLKACDPGLAIAEINGAPIPVGTQEDQVAQILREALKGDSTEGHLLHLIPRSLMTAESDDQKTRPINVEKSSSVSVDTNTTDKEETEC